MSVSPAVLQPGIQLGTGATVIYTNNTRSAVMIKRAIFTNVNASSETLTVYRVPSSGSPGTANIIIDAFPLSTTQAYVSPELSNMVLNPGDSIQGLSSAVTSINAFMSGFITG